MIKLEFHIRKVRVRRKDPREGFSETEAIVEYRLHPLFGFWARINMERAKRPKQVLEEGIDWVKKTKEGCPFCPERVEKVTVTLQLRQIRHRDMQNQANRVNIKKLYSN